MFLLFNFVLELNLCFQVICISRALISRPLFSHHSIPEFPICITSKRLSTKDLSQGITVCREYGAKLCSLNQMEEAFIRGYRNSNWGMYNENGRIARVTKCTQKHVQNNECHSVDPSDGGGFAAAGGGGAAGGGAGGAFVLMPLAKDLTIPNIPNPDSNQKAYCCK